MTIEYPARKLHRTDDPTTSIEAATGDRSTHRAKILQAFATTSLGLTIDEAAELSGLPQVETGRRISDLLALDLIKVITNQDGKPLTGTLKSGRRGRVYRITEAGLIEINNIKGAA